MSLISDGIESVRAYELPVGIRADGSYVGLSRAALVKWHSKLSSMLYQVYVNGQYAGTTVDSQQREMIVAMPTSLESPVRIEVFAVECEQGHIDFSGEIERPAVDSGRVRLSLLRGQDLPFGAIALVYYDGGSGQIDYQNPVGLPIRIWAAWQDKAGFGMSGFGSGDFGYDSAAAVGFGAGSFGQGHFGLDADTIEWTSPPLTAGIYKFAVKVFDQAGNESSVSETGLITVTPAARPAEGLSISSFDKQTNQLVLEIEARTPGKTGG
jgi:hypothetical protein